MREKDRSFLLSTGTRFTLREYTEALSQDRSLAARRLSPERRVRALRVPQSGHPRAGYVGKRHSFPYRLLEPHTALAAWVRLGHAEAERSLLRSELKRVKRRSKPEGSA